MWRGFTRQDWKRHSPGGRSPELRMARRILTCSWWTGGIVLGAPASAGEGRGTTSTSSIASDCMQRPASRAATRYGVKVASGAVRQDCRSSGRLAPRRNSAAALRGLARIISKFDESRGDRSAVRAMGIRGIVGSLWKPYCESRQREGDFLTGRWARQRDGAEFQEVLRDSLTGYSSRSATTGSIRVARLAGT